ncbi:MAG: C1 family peptidase [Marinifilaceae bacterium]
MKKLVVSTAMLAFVVMGLLLTINSCQKETVKDEVVQEQEEVLFNFGCIPTPRDVYEQVPLVEISSELKSYPVSVELDCPPVGNQGGEGSCVAWGTAYASRSISWKSANGGSYGFGSNIFSPEYVYNQIKATDNCGSGAYTVSGLELLKNQGVCVWDDMPYTDELCSLYPNDYQMQQAINYTISDYQRVSVTLDAFKQQLAQGKPIVVAGAVYKAFYNLGDGDVMTTARGRNYGGHCYCCVGYDDNLNAFKVLNSWGTSWGTNGYGWISYDIMAKVWSEAYVVFE